MLHFKTNTFFYFILTLFILVGNQQLEATAIPTREQARMIMDRLLLYYPDLMMYQGGLPNQNMNPYQQQQYYNQMYGQNGLNGGGLFQQNSMRPQGLFG